MKRKQHWESIYSQKKYTEITWYQSLAKQSLDLIHKLGLTKDAPIIDVGAGSSTLVDTLLNEGYQDITLFELSENAFIQTKQRLEGNSSKVQWLLGDITEFQFERKYTLWHDRAVFHFLTEASERDSYFENLKEALSDKGYFIISTFAEDGPLKCSGLEIVRYAKEDMLTFVGDEFELMHFEKETHVSPSGMEQKFNYWLFKRK